MDRVFVYIAVALLGAMLLYIVMGLQVKFMFDVTTDILDVTAHFCVFLFSIRLFCGRLTIEDGTPVIYNRRNIPRFLSIDLRHFDRTAIEKAMHVPLLKRIRVRCISAYIRLGFAGDAAKTVLTATAVSVALDNAFTAISRRHDGTLLRRIVRPVYTENSVKIAFSCILSMSVANIILSIAQLLWQGIMQNRRAEASARRKHKSQTAR